MVDGEPAETEDRRRTSRERRLEVLHCIYDDPENPWVGGGGAVRVREIYRRLTECVDVTVLSGRYPGAARQATVDGVRYVRLGAAAPYPWSRATYALAANHKLRSGRYDAAVFDFSTYTPVLVPRDRPVGITVHHISGPTAGERLGAVGGRAVAAWERQMLRRGRSFSATSSATRDRLVRLLPDRSEVEVVYAGVPDDLFSLRREPSDYLLYFGRIDFFQKGIDTLLGVMSTLTSERPGLRLRVAGRGKDLEQLRARLRAEGLERNVELLGAVSEAGKRELLRGALLQLMPSRFEGFGMVAAEAMAAGVPLIASDVDSLPEVVDAPRGGILAPAGDVRAWCAAVRRLLDDAGERQRLSVSARAAAERFRWANVADAHHRFLLHIAASAGATTFDTRIR